MDGGRALFAFWRLFCVVACTRARERNPWVTRLKGDAGGNARATNDARARGGKRELRRHVPRLQVNV